MSGFVHLVGAGPGDPELLTLKAVRCLGRADVVLFDDLAAGPMLTHARPGAELIAVGKRAGRASPKQAEIDRLLVDHALAGKRVVRLKSGDPGIFGRLEEEIVALKAAGIAFEIVPGVSAASAAAAAAAIPLTRRAEARRVQFVTGHDVTGALPADRNMAALADASATTVVFMPKRTFPALAEALIAHGLPPETPALMAEHVGCPDQRLTRSTVGGLAARLAEGVSAKAALILYGPLMEDL
ncbi:uroporphyrinogen-III C-methyltransferase [Sphingomonas sp. NCPPB 2930]|uniref:uroporphyrinogen-III C-methyltransferase n=1 Tax=Sphingomonas sp. NCPPB 2930 TaxID=3162788 RepID=UPI0036D8F25B